MGRKIIPKQDRQVQLAILEDFKIRIKRKANSVRNTERWLSRVELQWMLEKFGWDDELIEAVESCDYIEVREWLREAQKEAGYYEGLNIRELREKGRKRGLSKYSVLNKEDLIKLLEMGDIKDD